EEEESFFSGEFRADKIRLNENRPQVALIPYLSETGQGQLLCEGQTLSFDVVFPILHGPFGEDGTLQGLLDLMGVPYVGSGCASSANCMDKAITKQLCEKAGVKVAPYVELKSVSHLNTQAKAISQLSYPLFVKPSRMGSSVGVSKVTQPALLHAAVTQAFKFDSKVIIEEGISGREIECAVLGTSSKAQVAIPGEIVPNAEIGWYSYEAKYLLAEGAKTQVPADLSPELMKRFQEEALKVFQVMDCEGLARVDFFLEKSTQEIYLNEVNTMPGFTPISMYPKMWQASGLSYEKCVTELLNLALKKKL
ncbi:D-alanine--D-alanine ligase, partial [bacterium]|nr:D-alanine--D-alanine ligase [bacterium]